MTKEAQLIALARVCGKDPTSYRFFYKPAGKRLWKESPHYCNEYQAEEGRVRESSWSATKLVEPIISHENVPSYLDSLDAIHTAEAMLKPEDRHEYHRQLYLITRPESKDMWEHNWNFIHATPPQKAEALLKTLNLYTP